MNAMPKVVFSTTLETAGWNNTELVKSGPAAKLWELKQQPGNHMTILGSGNLVAQLAGENLIDEYQFVIVPVVLGAGRTMFEGMGNRLAMKLTRSQAFSNGNVFLCYEQKSQADQRKASA
jgi:dihydrofolate reductase